MVQLEEHCWPLDFLQFLLISKQNTVCDVCPGARSVRCVFMLRLG